MTDTDRVLLERAAKAAGVEVMTGWTMDDCAVLLDGTPWKPLTDDGDALRLAVKLGISLESRASIEIGLYQYPGGKTQGDYALGADAWTVERSSVKPISAQEVYGNDPYAATRRAIVRAAAALAPG